MTAYSRSRLARLLGSEGSALFIECEYCPEDSLAPVDDHFESDSGLPMLYVSEKRGLPATERPTELLRDVLLDALLNEDSQGRLHFECPSCTELNRLSGMTVSGPLDDYDDSLYISGEAPYPDGSRTPLVTVPTVFICSDCGCDCDADEARQTGPDAPEIGWRYYQCPACGTRTANAQGAV